jgi:hypothetical protein
MPTRSPRSPPDDLDQTPDYDLAEPDPDDDIDQARGA